VSLAWDEERRSLLETIQRIGDSGRAEGASTESLAAGFYPVPEHLRLLDIDVVMVVGPRGSGKTQITRVLTDAQLANAVVRFAPKVRLPSNARWLAAYPAGKEVFEGNALQAFVAKTAAKAGTLRDVWLAYLLRRLSSELDSQSLSSLSSVLKPDAADIEAVYDAFKKLGAEPIIALDRLDSRLASEERHLFVTYDELDTLGHGSWDLIQVGVEGLVALWAAYTRRWRNLRAKLFLRTDLYQRHARVGGADLYKLAASRVELVWSDKDLYGMLLKRLANGDDHLRDYVVAAKSTANWKEDSVLGFVPSLRRWDDARPIIERLVGAYMGADKKKGLVYRWLLDHVRDGVGRAYPRPLVQMIETAAGSDLARFEAIRKPKLVQPVSLRRALDKVSEDHVLQSADEWPWLDTLKARFRTNPLVPYTDKEVLRILEPKARESVAPPYEGRDLLDYLLELGILRKRADRRIDAPDLFLNGLGLRRKGGVRRGK